VKVGVNTNIGISAGAGKGIWSWNGKLMPRRETLEALSSQGKQPTHAALRDLETGSEA